LYAKIHAAPWSAAAWRRFNSVRSTHRVKQARRAPRMTKAAPGRRTPRRRQSRPFCQPGMSWTTLAFSWSNLRPWVALP